VVERATFWIDQASLAKVVHVLKLISVKAPGNVDSFAPDDDDSLPLEKSLGDDRGEATEEMAAAIDDQRFGGKTHLDKTVNAKQIGLCNKF